MIVKLFSLSDAAMVGAIHMYIYSADNEKVGTKRKCPHKCQYCMYGTP